MRAPRPFGDQGWREPMMMDDGALRCGECGAPVTSITRGRQPRPDGTLGPAEPARFGCGHLAGELGQLVETDLFANAPGPEAYWPELPEGLATIAGTYDSQPRSEVTYRIEPIDGGDDRG